MLSKRRLTAVGTVLLLLAVTAVYQGRAVAQKADGQSPNNQAPEGWVDQIEQVFIRSEECKQCHDRHYEEWKGAREQTPDLKTFGRVDAALLHGTSLESPVFRTVLGVWLQTNPTMDERKRCLSCHVPSTTVFPQFTEKITAQVLSGKPQIEGIGCASCHLIKSVESTISPPPTFNIEPGKTMHGPYADPEENLVHPAVQTPLFRGANYCASCHFDKVKDVTQTDLPGEILQGTICQDCHMEQSTGSSTSKRGAMTRSIGRHYFRGVVIPGILLKNRNLQAEWMPRIDIDSSKSANKVEGTALVKVGSLPHSFPDGDPVLKQFDLSITIKDAKGQVLAQESKHFGLPYDKILRGPIPDPFIKGGNTRKVPFSLSVPAEAVPTSVEAVLSYTLIPMPEPALKDKYLTTLKDDKEREIAKKILDEYAQPRMLTYRAKNL
jgi:nitrate/TMAO reductase-like tetraheme cytochrome c subunit